MMTCVMPVGALLLLQLRCLTVVSNRVVDINPNAQWSDDVELSLGSATLVEDMRYYDVTVDNSNEVQAGTGGLGYDLRLELDDDIGFGCSSSSSSSTLSLTLDGTTANPAMTNNAYLMLIFAVADRRFFAFVAYIGALSNIQSKVYPDGTLAHKTTSVASWIDTPAFASNRIQHASDGADWTNLDLLQPWNSATNAQWPLRFEIVNQAERNLSTVRFYHNDSVAAMSTHEFAESFACDEEISIYVMGGYMGSSPTQFRYQIANLRLTLGPTDDATVATSASSELTAELADDTASKLTAVPTRPQLIDMNVIKSDNATQQSGVVVQHGTQAEADGDGRTIETWFIAILIAAVVIFCAARIVMKIPTEKWCRDVRVSNEGDEDGEVELDMENGGGDVALQTRTQSTAQQTEKAKKMYNRVNSTADEYYETNSNKHCLSSDASTATSASSSSSSSSSSHRRKRRYQQRNAFVPEMEDRQKLMQASSQSQSSPSFSSSVSSRNHTCTHLQAQRSLDTMDTMSETISEHGLSSVVHEVERTRHLEVIPEDSNHDWEESRSVADQTPATHVQSTLKLCEDSFSSHAIYDEIDG